MPTGSIAEHRHLAITHTQPHICGHVTDGSLGDDDRCTVTMLGSTSPGMSACELPRPSTGGHGGDHQIEAARAEELLRGPDLRIGSIFRRTDEQQPGQLHPQLCSCGWVEAPGRIDPRNHPVLACSFGHQPKDEACAPRPGSARDLEYPWTGQPTDELVELADACRQTSALNPWASLEHTDPFAQRVQRCSMSGHFLSLSY